MLTRLAIVAIVILGLAEALCAQEIHVAKQSYDPGSSRFLDTVYSTIVTLDPLGQIARRTQPVNEGMRIVMSDFRKIVYHRDMERLDLIPRDFLADHFGYDTIISLHDTLYEFDGLNWNPVTTVTRYVSSGRLDSIRKIGWTNGAMHFRYHSNGALISRKHTAYSAKDTSITEHRYTETYDSEGRILAIGIRKLINGAVVWVDSSYYTYRGDSVAEAYNFTGYDFAWARERYTSWDIPHMVIPYARSWEYNKDIAGTGFREVIFESRSTPESDWGDTAMVRQEFNARHQLTRSSYYTEYHYWKVGSYDSLTYYPNGDLQIWAQFNGLYYEHPKDRDTTIERHVNTYDGDRLLVSEIHKGDATPDPIERYTFTYVTLGIDDPMSGAAIANVYPNPSHDAITIEHGLRGNVQLTVYSVTGTAIYVDLLSSAAEPHVQLNTQSWPAGAYVVVIRSGEEEVRANFVKK